jgi:hypothetical protein
MHTSASSGNRVHPSISQISHRNLPAIPRKPTNDNLNPLSNKVNLSSTFQHSSITNSSKPMKVVPMSQKEVESIKQAASNILRGEKKLKEIEEARKHIQVCQQKSEIQLKKDKANFELAKIQRQQASQRHLETLQKAVHTYLEQIPKLLKAIDNKKTTNPNATKLLAEAKEILFDLQRKELHQDTKSLADFSSQYINAKQKLSEAIVLK